MGERKGREDGEQSRGGDGVARRLRQCSEGAAGEEEDLEMVDRGSAPKERLIVLEMEETERRARHPAGRGALRPSARATRRKQSPDEGEVADGVDEVKVDAARERSSCPSKEQAAGDGAVVAVEAEQTMEELARRGAGVEMKQEAEHAVVVVPERHVATR